MDDDYRYSASRNNGMDSSRSSPALPLYASPNSANPSMFPGQFSQLGGSGPPGVQQRHSFHIPPSYTFDGGNASDGGEWRMPAQNTGLSGLGAGGGMHETRRSFGSDSVQYGAERGSSGGTTASGMFPFSRGFNIGLHTTQSHDSTALTGGERDHVRTLAPESSSFLGRSASLGTKKTKPRRGDLESGMTPQDAAVEVEDEGEDGWDDLYAGGYARGRQAGGLISSGYGQARVSGGTMPQPLNTHLTLPSGAASAPAGGHQESLIPGSSSPMSVTMSPHLYASNASGSLNGQQSATRDGEDPWPQYRQAGGMQQQQPQYNSRYGHPQGASVIDISPTEHSGDPFTHSGGQNRQPPSSHGIVPPPSASAMSIDSRSSHTPMDYTPAGHALPYLPADLGPNAHPPSAYNPQRLQNSRSQSSHHLPTQRPTATPQSAQVYRGTTPGAENGYAEARNRSARQGFRRINIADPESGLRPMKLDPSASGRRADPNVTGAFLSPLKCLTSQLTQTYNICNPNFRYEVAHNPRRVLTKPSKPCHNGGFDNEDYDYILYVNDMLTADNGAGDKYLILDVLGQGTFGQVVKCQNMRTHELVAVKVVKNKPAYLNQSLMEVAILQLLNQEHDKHDEHHLLRMMDHFQHRRHLCLVFECLASNLYELIKHNQFRGLSLQLVKMFTTQLLDALKVLKDARLIHCDLKPENILLKSLNSPTIKIIDFGSACHERQTVYTYIQSRFYRSPEVLLGLPYSSAIDMWSLGCIVVELFLGLPLFPGTSEYNQLSRITEMLGEPPAHLLEVGKQVNEFFNVSYDQEGRKRWRLKPMDQYAAEHQTTEQPSKQYFKATKLPEIVKTYPLPKKVSKQADVDKEMNMRAAFIDFVQGLLDMDPITRWSPHQAEKHPFITGERFTAHWNPATWSRSESRTTPSSATTDSRSSQSKKYGGLVSTPSNRGQRAYPDAAAYNQQLAQHQAYTAAQQQAANTQTRHPFAEDSNQAVNYGHHRMPSNARGHQTQPRLPSNSNGMQASISASAFPAQTSMQPQYAPPVANPPPTSYYPTTRNRANTINQMDQIPPALARLTHLGVQDPAGTRSSLTPVLNRDEAIREWERRGHAKRLSANPNNPQLDYLQEQAELAGQAWGANYGAVPPYPMQPALTVDDYQRTNRVGQHRAQASSSDFGFPDPSSAAAAQARGVASPRRHHGGTAGGSMSGPGYLPAFPPPTASAFDSYDPRGDASLALMYTPLQPNSANNRGQMQGSGHRQAASMHQAYGHNPFAPGSSGTSPILLQSGLSPGQQAPRRASGGYGDGYGDYGP